MKPIIIVSYYFPPIGMAGPGRALGLFRHLPKFGYQPYVVTVKDILYAAHDHSALKAEDERYITRTESLDPSRILHRLGKWTPPVHAPTSGARQSPIMPDWKRLWNRFAISAANHLIESVSPVAVITTSPPPSSHLIGMELKRRHKIPWIADFRDLWFTRGIDETYASNSSRQNARKILNNIQGQADLIVAINDSVKNFVGAQVVIPNGADPSTFVHWDAPQVDASQPFTIGYLGTPDSDATVVTLARAFAQISANENIAKNQVRVRFIGVSDSAEIANLFARNGVPRSVECTGYLDRHSAIQAAATCDALMVAVSDNSLKHVTTSKIFDYLASGKPLLGIAPENGELWNLLRSEGEYVTAPGDSTSLAEHILELLVTRLEESDQSHDRMAIRRARYSWKAMAEKYSIQLDTLTKK